METAVQSAANRTPSAAIRNYLLRRSKQMARGSGRDLTRHHRCCWTHGRGQTRFPSRMESVARHAGNCHHSLHSSRFRPCRHRLRASNQWLSLAGEATVIDDWLCGVVGRHRAGAGVGVTEIDIKRLAPCAAHAVPRWCEASRQADADPIISVGKPAVIDPAITYRQH